MKPRYIKTRRTIFRYNDLESAVNAIKRIRRADPSAKLVPLKDQDEFEQTLDPKRLVHVEP